MHTFCKVKSVDKEFNSYANLKIPLCLVLWMKVASASGGLINIGGN